SNSPTQIFPETERKSIQTSPNGSKNPLFIAPITEKEFKDKYNLGDDQIESEQLIPLENRDPYSVRIERCLTLIRLMILAYLCRDFEFERKILAVKDLVRLAFP